MSTPESMDRALRSKRLHPYAQHVIPRTGENTQQGDMGAMRSVAMHLEAQGLPSMAETFRKAISNAPRRVA